MLTEGIEYDPHAKALFVAVDAPSQIIRVDHAGGRRNFVTTKRDGIWSPAA